MREKLGSGWVGQASTRLIFFFLKMYVSLCFFVLLFVVVHVSKKLRKMNRGWVGAVWPICTTRNDCMANPSFPRISGFFLP